jgi:hypothetical protein
LEGHAVLAAYENYPNPPLVGKYRSVIARVLQGIGKVLEDSRFAV